MRAVALKAVLVTGIFLLSVSGLGFAANDPGTVKQEIASDKEAIGSERAEMKSDAKTAKGEEAAIREQIAAARQAGDVEKVKALEAQLKSMHRENVADRKEDKKDLHAAKKELRQDVRAARRMRHPRPLR